jgi:hypothetical protein
MKRGTKLFLLAGCAWIVALDGPAALAALGAGWRGPYAGGATDVRSAQAAAASERLLASAAPELAVLARR